MTVVANFRAAAISLDSRYTMLQPIQWFLLAVFAFPLLEYLLEMATVELNRCRWQRGIPGPLQDVLNVQEFRRAKAYALARRIPDQWRGTFDILVFFTLIWTGVIFDLNDWLWQWSGGQSWIQLPLYMGVVGFFFSILSLPFDYYDTFVVEERFEFNRMTLSTFAMDRIKGGALSILLGGPILALLAVFLDHAGWLQWLLAFSLIGLIVVFLSFVAPVWILPLFNKIEPMPDGTLKRAIENMARRENFSVQNIFTMDGSRRSSRANAFFTGFGKSRRVVLLDTLVDHYSTDEILSILAHEIGHAKLGHIPGRLFLSLLQMGIGLGLLFAFFHFSPFRVYDADGITTIPVEVFLAGILFSPLGIPVSILSSALSRKWEFDADRFAKNSMGTGKYLASALKRLSRESLSHPDPHPLKVMLHYSHPPLIQRLEGLER